IPKGRGHREIRSPREGLKVIQKRFGHQLARSPAIGLPSACHGFVPGRSLISAAREHLGAGWVYATDIRDFFGAVSSERVLQTLRSLGYSRDSAELLGCLATLGGALPQGSTASPVLANIAFAETDRALEALAEGCGIKYTRYADDLSF